MTRIPGAFSKVQADEVIQDVWTRLGMSATDKTTWIQGRNHLPKQMTFDAEVFAPRAWAAICELCGGEDRVEPSSKEWRDALIVNLGTAENEGKTVSAKELKDWRKRLSLLCGVRAELCSLQISMATFLSTISTLASSKSLVRLTLSRNFHTQLTYVPGDCWSSRALQILSLEEAELSSVQR